MDGARIKIPDRLLTPPESDQPYIIDLLGAAALDFKSRFLESHSTAEPDLIPHSKANAEELIHSLLGSDQHALTEYELFGLAFSIARRHSIDFRPYLAHLDLGAFTAQQKYALSSAVGLEPEDDLYIWNSVVRSDILTLQDLRQRNLNRVLPLQRLYSSQTNGLATFFQYLRIATQEFTRKLLILKVSLFIYCLDCPPDLYIFYINRPMIVFPWASSYEDIFPGMLTPKSTTTLSCVHLCPKHLQ